MVDQFYGRVGDEPLAELKLPDRPRAQILRAWFTSPLSVERMITDSERKSALQAHLRDPEGSEPLNESGETIRHFYERTSGKKWEFISSALDLAAKPANKPAPKLPSPKNAPLGTQSGVFIVLKCGHEQHRSYVLGTLERNPFGSIECKACPAPAGNSKECNLDLKQKGKRWTKCSDLAKAMKK